VIAYGTFLNVLLNFIVLALVVFIMVRQVNRMRQSAAKAPAAPPEDVVLLREIRDALVRK
jgi:large conductance mechanosensitive channel